MTNVLNLNGESDANMIGDDVTPTLTLENASSGNALKVQTITGTGIPLVASSGATEVPAAAFQRSVLGSPTVAVFRTTASTASAAHWEVRGFLASTASMGSIIRGIRVKIDNDLYGWLPVYASATYI